MPFRLAATSLDPVAQQVALDQLNGRPGPHVVLRVTDTGTGILPENIVEGGTLRLRWQVLTPRRIAMIVLPRLAVSFEFVAVAEAERQRFMRHFDLATQRGGG